MGEDNFTELIVQSINHTVQLTNVLSTMQSHASRIQYTAAIYLTFLSYFHNSQRCSRDIISQTLQITFSVHAVDSTQIESR